MRVARELNPKRKYIFFCVLELERNMSSVADELEDELELEQSLDETVSAKIHHQPDSLELDSLETADSLETPLEDKTEQGKNQNRIQTQLLVLHNCNKSNRYASLGTMSQRITNDSSLSKRRISPHHGSFIVTHKAAMTESR